MRELCVFERVVVCDKVVCDTVVCGRVVCERVVCSPNVMRVVQCRGFRLVMFVFGGFCIWIIISQKMF